jgi:DNA-binding CsgD family transcriptional regulator
MLVSRSGLSPVMVGRDAEFGQLLRLLGSGDGTAAGGPASAVALIGGQAGIGKTRLVSELITAVPSVARVLIGQADPGALGQPYHLLLDVVDGYGTADGQTATLIEQVGDAGRPPQERSRAGQALLARLRGDGLTVLVLDDLHWADAESVAVFERLVDAPAAAPLLLVGTYRPEALTRQHPVADLLQRLERRHTVAHMRLQPLALGDVARFLTAVYGRSPSHRAASALHQRTGGNPFFLEELLKAAGGSDLDEMWGQPLPWTLAEALRSQLDELTPAQRRVVEAAAVLGARVSFDLLMTVIGTDEAELIGALRDLVRRGLLVESDEDQFAFRHALTREAIAGEMLGRERRRLHQAALEVLRTQDAPDLAAVAMHARGAGRYEDMVAAARLGCAQRLASGSTYAALKLAELALEEEPDDAVLLSTAATAAWLAGYPKDARRYAEQWLGSAREAEQHSAALRLLVRLAFEDRDLTGMDARTAEVHAVIDSLPVGEEQARAMAALAQSHMLRGRRAEAVEWADAAAALATELDLSEVRIAALVEKGTTLLYDKASGDTGRVMLLEASAEAERAGQYVLASRALHNLMWAVHRIEPALASGLLERMRTNAERAGFGDGSISYHEGRSQLAVVAGDLDKAIAALEDVRSDSPGWPPNQRLNEVASELAVLCLERGDLDRSERVLADLPESPGWHARTAALAFQAACRRGDVIRARALLPEMLTAPAFLGLSSAELVHMQVAAGVAAGLRVEELRMIAEQPTGEKGTPDSPDEPMQVLIAAQLAETEGHYVEALEGYERAASATQQQMLCVCRASALVGAARCLLALGRPGPARAAVEAASPLLARWPGWRRSELDAVARRLRLSTVDDNGGPPGLTRREMEVVALLAEGLSNAEVARRLVISRKTAAVHVSNILSKLGMSSRAQVAAWASQGGVDQAS